MVIERCFGVLKARFPTLSLMPNLKPLRQRSDELFYTWETIDLGGGAS